MKTIYRQWIGKRLYQYRVKHNMLMTDVSNSLGIQWTTYQAWEHGRAEPSIYNLQRICRLFKVRVDTFLEGSPH